MSRPSLLNNYYGNNTRTCFVYKKGDCQLTRYTKEEHNKAREGFKRYIHQYLIDNNINNNFNKDIIAVLTTTSGNFFYNNYGVKHFITLNGPILIETAKNIVTSINNNAFVHGLTSSTEPGGMEPSTARRGDVGNKSSDNKGKSATYFCNNNNNNINIENLTVDINFLNYYSDDDKQDYGYLDTPITPLISVISVMISVTRHPQFLP